MRGAAQKVGSYVKHTWKEVWQEMRDSSQWDYTSEEDEDEEGGDEGYSD